MEERITFIGLDVHKTTIAVAIANGGSREAARCYGTIENTSTALTKLASKLAGEGARLQFCYEAGPCGYGVYRHLLTLGHCCLVAAPSLIPRRCGDRVKTDRRAELAQGSS
ncbi:MAG: IS110 family transposase, partial [Acetobacteraceae bacterium]|nr:IS110 family transposase [Acetobacteraceae bacterium]